MMPTHDVASFTQQLREGRIAGLTFTSSSTVKNFVELLGGREIAQKLAAQAVIACIGPITARTAEEYGLTVGILPTENTIPALADAIARYFREEARIAVSAS
jgi:uroporphyrinogen III methyltransferase/synthase